jgi:hypothetical protein
MSSLALGTYKSADAHSLAGSVLLTSVLLLALPSRVSLGLPPSLQDSSFGAEATALL